MSSIMYEVVRLLAIFYIILQVLMKVICGIPLVFRTMFVIWSGPGSLLTFIYLSSFVTPLTSIVI